MPQKNETRGESATPSAQAKPRPSFRRLLQQRRAAYAAAQRPIVDKADIWLCQFCEYQLVFGVEPYGLARAYDLREKKLLRARAERRRLLEMVKQRGKRLKNKQPMHKDEIDPIPSLPPTPPPPAPPAMGITALSASPATGTIGIPHTTKTSAKTRKKASGCSCGRHPNENPLDSHVF